MGTLHGTTYLVEGKGPKRSSVLILSFIYSSFLSVKGMAELSCFTRGSMTMEVLYEYHDNRSHIRRPNGLKNEIL